MKGVPRHKRHVVEPICVECGKLGRMTSGARVYPDKPERHRDFYFACDCGAAVSCHPGTAIPAGRPASPHTRYLRFKAHEAFDRIWRRPNRSPIAMGHARAKAYKWLARELGIPSGEAHIGWFDAEQCERTIELCTIRLGEAA